MRYANDFSVQLRLCNSTYDVSRKKQCQNTRNAKKKKTKKRWNIEKDTLEPVHTAWLQNVTHPRPEKTCARARACTLPVSP